MTIKHCNMCGEELDLFDEQLNFHYHNIVPYGSDYDGCEVEIDLCTDCFDKYLHHLISKCELDPVVRDTQDFKELYEEFAEMEEDSELMGEFPDCPGELMACDGDCKNCDCKGCDDEGSEILDALTKFSKADLELLRDMIGQVLGDE